MKKSLLALAVLGAFASAASAQSSVTLSGGVDAAIQRVNDQWQMSTGNSGRTNFTLSGREDLGGGMYAFFAFNHRFNQGTGAVTSQNFWRQTWVGLGGGFGNVRLGRMLPTLQTFNGDFDAWGTDTIGSVHTGGFSAGTTNARVNNSIYYTSPNMGGLELHGNIGAADNNGAGETLGSERPVGVGVRYLAGPLRVALAYDRDGTDLKTTGIYAGYNFGMADVMFQYEKGDISTTVDQTVYSISGKVPMGAAVFKVGYRNNSDAEQKKFAVGLDYNLSKRTTVYTNAAKQSGDGYSEAAKKAMFDVGIWHRF